MRAKKPKQVLGAVVGRIRRVSLQGLFLVLFLAFGLVFTLLVPPGWNTDETNHLYRIAQLSEGNLLSERVVDPQTGIKAYGGDVPSVLIQLFGQTGATTPGGIGNPNNKIDKHLYSNQPQILTERDTGQRQSINFSGAALYSPVTYALYLPVFWLGTLCSLPMFWIVMLCRLVGLVVTGISFYLAIKYVPVGKWMFFAVGLLPGVVIQAQSIGADAPELAACVLFTALIVRRVYAPRPLRPSDYVLFGLLGTLVAFTKLVYVPVLLLLFALPLLHKIYRNRATALLLLGVVAVATVPSLVWSHLVAYVDINSNPQADFAAQKAFVLHQPLTYVHTLYYTFFTNQQTALTNLFGGLVALPPIYAYLAPAVLTLSLFVRSSREATVKVLSVLQNRLWRLMLVGPGLLAVVLIATALYVYSSTLHQSSIISIQARYFLPLLPLLLLTLRGGPVANQRTAKIALVSMSCLILVGAALAIYERLYQIIPFTVT